MGSIVKMKSKEFFDLVDRYNYKDFNFLLISQDIRTNGGYSNVFSLNRLIPPANIVSEFITNGYTKKYKKKYIRYLTNGQVEPILATIVKLAVVENVDTILLCSDNEEQYKYLDMIGEFLKDEYSCTVCSYKKFRKKRKETDNTKNKKKIVEILNKKLEDMDVPETYSPSPKKFKRHLKELGKNELLRYCEANHIKVKSKWDKKRIIDNIINTTF